jgi:hypothetical protein
MKTYIAKLEDHTPLLIGFFGIAILLLAAVFVRA